MKNIFLASEELIRNDVYLLVVHANNVPPHLSLSVHGKLFSIQADGVKLGEDIAPLLKLIHIRRIETLFINLKLPPIINLENLRHQIASATASYPGAVVGKVTCLAPIKDFCHNVFETSIQDVDFIFDLLPKLEEQEVLGQSYHLNMDRLLTVQGSFQLRTYSMFDVNERIREVQSLIVAY